MRRSLLNRTVCCFRDVAAVPLIAAPGRAAAVIPSIRADAVATRDSSVPSLGQTLRDVPRVSPQDWRRLGRLRRWLITLRASVLPLTLFAALFGGLLALPWTVAEAWRLVLVTSALVLAHATSNLLNDGVDWLAGVDRDSYFRIRYGTHPLAQGLMSLRAFLSLLLVMGTAALLLAAWVCWMTGGVAWWLAGAGAFLMLFYTWPLKRLGLGEPAVFLVWGPLMVGGGYWVVSGDWGHDIAVLAGVFGLGATVVVFAKHTDKRSDDAARRIRTLPVLLGPRWSPRVLAGLAVTQLAAGVGWALLSGQWPYLVILAAAPALVGLVRVCSRPRPAARPEAFPANLWPLWYTVAAFRFAGASSAALVAAALLKGI